LTETTKPRTSEIASRRHFLKMSALAAATLTTPLSVLRGADAVDGGVKPNILIILADDMGYSDLGCYGGEVETPNIDGLASNGVRFSQFYNTAKCTPSRVSLMTGLYEHQAGSASMKRGVTIAQVLRQTGYFTAITGKWHLSDEPTDWGFDRYFGHLSGSTNYWTGDKTYRLNGKPFTDFGEDFYSTDANTDYAIRFIDEAIEQKKPFFMYVAHNAPHSPLQAYEKDVQKYRGQYRTGWDELRRQRYKRQVEMGLIKSSWELSERPAYIPAWDSLSEEQKDWEDFRRAAFSAAIDRLDQNVGRLVSHLKEKDAVENTLILVLSDNGADSRELGRGHEYPPWDSRSHWLLGTGWANAANTPFRWYKMNQHEGGISTPLIAHWPKGLKTSPGEITHQPGHIIDISATLYDLASASYPATCDGREITPLQGNSLLPILQGKTREGHDWMYFQYMNNRAIRKGKWKLVSVRSGPWELYDIENDRTELHDLVDEYPEVAVDLRDLWQHVADNVDHLPEKWNGPLEDSIRPWGSRGGEKPLPNPR